MSAQVMLIDDDPTNTALLEQLFSRNARAPSLEIIHNPTNALDHLRERARTSGASLPAMILLDINMPLMNGFEVQAHLQQCEALRDIPVVFLSTSSSERDIEEALRLGAHAYLQKGMGLQDMKDVVTRVTEYLGALVPFHGTLTEPEMPSLLRFVGGLQLPNVIDIDRKAHFQNQITALSIRPEQRTVKQEEDTAFGFDDLERIVSLLPDAVFLTDASQRITCINPGFTSIFGYTAEEIVGQTAQGLYVDAAQYLIRDRARLGTKGAEAPFACEFRCKDERIFEAEVRCRQVHDDRGEVTGSLMILRDITERQRAEEDHTGTLATHERRSLQMQLLHELSTREYRNVDDALRTLLQRSCEILDMELGLICQVEGTQGRVVFSGNDASRDLEGMTLEVEELYCSRMMRQARQTLALSVESAHVSQEGLSLQERALTHYLGTALYVDGALFGTLRFSCTHRRTAALDDVDAEYLEILGGVVSALLSRSRAEEALRQERDMLRGMSDLQRRLASLDHDVEELVSILANRGRRLLRAVEFAVELKDGTHASSTSPRPGQATKAPLTVPLMFYGETLGYLTMVLAQGDRRKDPRAGLELVAGIAATRLNNLARELRMDGESTVDPLTCVFNRRWFLRRAELELARCREEQLPMTLAILDLDHFHELNRVYGHSTGDRVLRLFGEFLLQIDATIAGRWGGGAFVLAFPTLDQERATARITRLQNQLQEVPLVFESGKPLHITFGGGVAQRQDADQRVQDMMGRVERALSVAKEYGRGRVLSDLDLEETTEVDEDV